MHKKYSLSYFQDIFGDDRAGLREVLEAVVQSLEEWKANYRRDLLARDQRSFSAQRHKAVTVLENLGLVFLIRLSEEGKALLASDADDGALEANAAAVESQIDQILDGLAGDVAALAV